MNGKKAKALRRTARALGKGLPERQLLAVKVHTKRYPHLDKKETLSDGTVKVVEPGLRVVRTLINATQSVRGLYLALKRKGY